jgi:hypothetical protein
MLQALVSHVPGVAYKCCKCYMLMLQKRSDVAMLNIVHTHISSVLHGCRIFNQKLECSNQHETRVRKTVRYRPIYHGNRCYRSGSVAKKTRFTAPGRN